MIDPIDVAFFQGYGFDYVETIGRGAYGIIYKVYSHQYKINFALKRILAEQFHANEVDCMIQIRSSCIVTLYKYYHHKQYVYMLMEFCPNSVEKIITETQNIPILKYYQIALGLVASVCSCHENGIAHGDIKPSNFLMDANDRVKICDFGLARKIEADENSTAYSGTFMFLAPEVLKKEPFDPFAADIWALGVTLYNLVTGKWPWCMESRQLMIHSIMNSLYNEDRLDDHFFKKIIKDCLNVDPTKRPSITAIMKAIRSKIDQGAKKIVRPLSTALLSNSLIMSPNRRRHRLLSN